MATGLEPLWPLLLAMEKRMIKKFLILIAISLTFIVSAGHWTFAANSPKEEIIKVEGKKFEFSPSEITLKKGVAVTLELTSTDVMHGIKCPELGIRADMIPGKWTRIHIMPLKTGTFSFYCDVLCGDGHEYMTGTIIVKA